MNTFRIRIRRKEIKVYEYLAYNKLRKEQSR